MEIKTLLVSGFEPAMLAARNPLNSWPMSDSYTTPGGVYVVGEKDKDLSLRLQKAGPEHCKHLRMIMTWMEITAPRYMLTELDTYRHGVEKVSCSTMHKLTSRPIVLEDFEYDKNAEDSLGLIVVMLNNRMAEYKRLKREEKEDEAKLMWRSIIELLPQSYLQKRTYMFSYAALRNIVRQREGHKLREWKTFIDACRELPESWMIFE